MPLQHYCLSHVKGIYYDCLFGFNTELEILSPVAQEIRLLSLHDPSSSMWCVSVWEMCVCVTVCLHLEAPVVHSGYLQAAPKEGDHPDRGPLEQASPKEEVEG